MPCGPIKVNRHSRGSPWQDPSKERLGRVSHSGSLWLSMTVESKLFSTFAPWILVEP